MVILSRFTTIAAGLVSAASALPANTNTSTNTVDHHNNKPRDAPVKGFTVNQISRASTRPKAGFAATYASALNKYKINVPSVVKAAAEAGHANATPEENDQEYLTPVNVGGTTLNLDIDTGSADLWVFSDQLPQREQSGHDIYKPSSKSSKMSGSFWQISYGDGSYASGDVYKDVVSVGNVSYDGQAVEAASEISRQFAQDKDNDGLLGLAFSKINEVLPVSQKTFFDNVKDRLDSPLFAVALKHNAPGSYDFGFIDHAKFKGDIVYADVDSSKGFWNFTAKGYTIGNGRESSTPIAGIADTGTSLLLINDDIADAYYKPIPSSDLDEQLGVYTIPCNAKLPPFTVNINGYKAVIPGEHLNYGPADKGSQTCIGGLQGNQGQEFSIFGDVFLKSQYVVFDSNGSSPRLGFAAQA